MCITSLFKLLSLMLGEQLKISFILYKIFKFQILASQLQLI